MRTNAASGNTALGVSIVYARANWKVASRAANMEELWLLGAYPSAGLKIAQDADAQIVCLAAFFAMSAIVR